MLGFAPVQDYPEYTHSDGVHNRSDAIRNCRGVGSTTGFVDAVQNKETNDGRKKIRLEESTNLVVVLFMGEERKANIMKSSVNLLKTLFLVQSFVEPPESFNLDLSEIGVFVLAAPFLTDIKSYATENETVKMARIRDDAVRPEFSKSEFFVAIIRISIMT